MWDWLLGKNETSEAQATVEAVKSKGVIWLETASEEVFQATMTAFYEEVKKLPRYPNNVASNNASVYAGALGERIGKLDRSRMDATQKKQLSIIIFGTFPRAIAKLETELLNPDEQEWAVENFGEKILDIISSQIDPLPRKVPIPNIITQVTEVEEKTVVTKVGNADSDAKLKTVKELAKEAYRLATSPEDKFFAEQAANSYIPDSVRLLTGLVYAPDDMKAEANELFLRQLTVLESQLDAIVRRTATHSLAEMKAHTEFP